MYSSYPTFNCLLALIIGYTSCQSVDQKIDALIQNMTQLKTEMVRSEVFQLYINQDADHRLRLEQKMADLEKNNSVLQVLYEDARQQQEQLKATVATQAQEIRQLALTLLDSKINQDIFNESLTVVQANVNQEAIQLNVMKDNLTGTHRSLDQQSVCIDSLRDNITALQRKLNTGNIIFLTREKGRDLTQSYDKSPYTNRNVKRAK